MLCLSSDARHKAMLFKNMHFHWSFVLKILSILIGQHFVIISNKGLAKQALQSSHPLGRLAKWLGILQEYDFSIKIVKGDCSNLKNVLIDLRENPNVNLLSAISINDRWYWGIYKFLHTFSFPHGCTSYEHKKIRRDSRHQYLWWSFISLRNWWSTSVSYRCRRSI